jgi:hypothetical protein
VGRKEGEEGRSGVEGRDREKERENMGTAAHEGRRDWMSPLNQATESPFL